MTSIRKAKKQMKKARPYLESQEESEVIMKRRFFRFYKARIPRKLKKAAKYGIERRVYPKTEEKDTAVGHAYIYTENVKLQESSSSVA